MVNYDFLDFHFRCSKNFGNRTRVTRLKVAPNMADPTAMKHSVSNLKYHFFLNNLLRSGTGKNVKWGCNYPVSCLDKVQVSVIGETTMSFWWKCLYTKLPHKVKMQHMYYRLVKSYFLFPWGNPAEMSRRSIFFHN